MVSGIGSYGGTTGVVKVGDQYWTSMLIAIPGNPCGSGSSGVSTDLILPRNTQFDASRSIRCFYLPRNASNTDQFVEVTGQTWSAFGSSGDVCPAQPSPSSYHQGAYNIGFRPLASGTQLEIFVPVTSSSTLDGSGGPDLFSWLTDATGVYANPGLSRVYANVFSSGGSDPFVYFSRTPSAVPFWKADADSAPADLRNRTEFFANFYVAQKAGNVSFAITRTDVSPAAAVVDSTNPAAGFEGAVPAGNDSVQVQATGLAAGPNGGYAPFAWDKPGQNGNPYPKGEWDTPMRITWTFTPSSGPAVTGFQDFTTLAGEDSDGDGVADINDACPTVKGTTADGCLPPAPPDPDGDGVYGSDDKCPDVAASGHIDGCPAPAGPGAPGPAPDAAPTPGLGTGTAPGGALPSPPTPAQLVATLPVKKNTRIRHAALRSGLKVKVACSADATAQLTLSVSGATVKSLGLKGRKATVARTSGRCTRAKGATLTLKVARKTLARIKRLRSPVPAVLALGLSAPGATAGSASVAVKLSQ